MADAMSPENVKKEPEYLANVKMEIEDEDVKIEPEFDTIEYTRNAEENTLFMKQEPAWVSNEPEWGNNTIEANSVVKQEVPPPDEIVHDLDVFDQPVVVSKKYSAIKFIKKKQSSEMATYTCDVCQKRFPEMQSLIDHKMYDRDNCKKQFIDTFQFIPDDTFSTSHFDKLRYDGGRNISVLIPTIPTEKVQHYSCDVCDKKCGRYGSLQKHKETHNICDGCQQSFATSSALAKHSKICSIKRVYVCRFCYGEFEDPLTLKEHEEVHFLGESFYCDICNKEFDQKRKLVTHSKMHGRGHNFHIYKSIHAGSKEYACVMCDEKFTHLKQLTGHCAATHQIAFHCDMCDKSYLREGNLINHRLTHSYVSQTYTIMKL